MPNQGHVAAVVREQFTYTTLFLEANREQPNAIYETGCRFACDVTIAGMQATPFVAKRSPRKSGTTSAIFN